MKTMKMIVAMATVMMMSSFTSIEAAENASPAPHNIEVAVNAKRATRTMLHRTSEGLNKFDYTLDAEGRVASKTMYRWDAKNDEWRPICMLSTNYEGEENELIYAAWDNASGSFTADITISDYDKAECPVLLKLPEMLAY